MTSVGDQFAFQEITPEEHRQMSDRILNVVKQIELSSSLTSGMSLAALEIEQRQVIEEALGVYGGEAIVSAAQPSFLLWTDDLVLGQFGVQQFGARRIWTQLLLQWAASNGLLDPDKFFEATAKLIGWNYRFTSLNPPAVQKAGELAEWSTSRWPLKQVIEQFGSPEVEFTATVQLFLHTLRLLHQSESAIRLSGPTITAILDRIGSLARGVQAIEQITSSIDRLFGVNLLGRDSAAKLLNAWLESYRSGGHRILDD